MLPAVCSVLEAHVDEMCVFLGKFGTATRKSQLERMRKRTVGSAQQDNLEKKLVEWITHHDATHGGKIPLSDFMIISKVGCCPRPVLYVLWQCCMSI